MSGDSAMLKRADWRALREPAKAASESDDPQLELPLASLMRFQSNVDAA
jgi:hypothetical protein